MIFFINRSDAVLVSDSNSEDTLISINECKPVKLEEAIPMITGTTISHDVKSCASLMDILLSCNNDVYFNPGYGKEKENIKNVRIGSRIEIVKTPVGACTSPEELMKLYRLSIDSGISEYSVEFSENLLDDLKFPEKDSDYPVKLLAKVPKEFSKDSEDLLIFEKDGANIILKETQVSEILKLLEL